MPYVRCPHCGLRSYSAARFSGRDTCPGCHETFLIAPHAVPNAPVREEREPVTVGRSGEEDDGTD